jgi:hypothetical protein
MARQGGRRVGGTEGERERGREGERERDAGRQHTNARVKVE